MPFPKPIRIVTRYPDPRKTAKMFGLTERETRQVNRLVEKQFSRKTRRPR